MKKPAGLSAPTKRSQAIYCRVVIEGCDVEQVARDFRIGVPRVKQLVGQVRSWIRGAKRSVDEERTGDDSSSLRQLHLARLEHQWEQVMLAWYRSTQVEETEKVLADEKGQRKAEKTRRSQTGDVRYLEQARAIMQEIRELLGDALNQQPAEEQHVESLTLDEREAALDRLLENLGQRARATPARRTTAGENVAA